MAQNKKSFILYADLLATIEKLTDAKAGKLFKTILEYVNDKNPEVTDVLLQIAFEPIKQQLKRDLKDWEAERSKRSEAGKKGGINSGVSRRSEAKRRSASKNEANEADNVTVTVNDTVNVKRESTGAPAFDLSKSNLNRQPNIPTKNQVWEIFVSNGGTKEMASAFWNKHEATGWFINGSPIVSVPALAQNFIRNWNNSEPKGTKENSPPLKTI